MVKLFASLKEAIIYLGLVWHIHTNNIMLNFCVQFTECYNDYENCSLHEADWIFLMIWFQKGKFKKYILGGFKNLS